MNADLEKVIRDNIAQALESLGFDPHDQPREAEAEIRARFLEHWTDFSKFGVESASALDRLRIVVRRKATAQALAVDIHVDVRGTPLEGWGKLLS